MDKFAKALPKGLPITKPSAASSVKQKNVIVGGSEELDKNIQNQELNGSFLDD